jgi:hypothetical protein
MALLDLSQVTSTLTTLLQRNINEHLQPAGPTVTVVPTVPNLVQSGTQNHLSLYLYHVSEDAYYRNAVGAGNDPPNVAKAPMGLCLYYLLTAHHTGNDDPANDALTQQRLLGLGLKTFHDIPVVTDNTRVNGTPILPAALRGRQNSLQVIMRQITPEEALHFWSSEDQQMARLSAYYEVRVVFLVPEEPASQPGIVLHLGAYLVQTGAPLLSGTESRVPFTLPPSYGGRRQVITASPARAVIDDRPPGALPEEHRRFELLGTSLTAGVGRTIVLRNARWNHTHPTLTELRVDLPLNPDWALTASNDRISVEFRSRLNYTDAAGLPQVETLWPGLYTVELRVELSREDLLGHPKSLVAASNPAPFMLAPRVAGHAVVGTHLQVDLGTEIDLTLLTENHDQVQVSLDGVVYTEVPNNPPLAPGQWFRLANAVLLHPAANVDLAPGNPEVHAFRLVINGAETPPHFVELP